MRDSTTSTGLLRAVDFAPDYHCEAPAVRRLTRALLDALNDKEAGASSTDHPVRRGSTDASELYREVP